MWRFALGIALAVACVHGQPIESLLLPQGRHIVGMVVDPDGTPVAEARIDHSGVRGRPTQTNAEGRFELDTRAPIVVIRKAGFRSELVRTQNAMPVRVTLHKLGDGQHFPICAKTGSYEGIDGWGASFQFPRVSGVKASPQGRDSDYASRDYFVETKSGPKGIRHGSGPMWSFGIPVDQDVWRSVDYEEITYDFDGRTILDARGRMSKGNRWRYLGKFGESAWFSDVDEATAKILDMVLDGACVKPTAR